MASVKENIRETILGVSEAVQEKWNDLTQFLQEAWPLLALLLFILMGIWWYADPPPPRHVSLATGSAGGSYEMLGKKYAEFFATKGVTLELVSTNGAQDNLNRLMDRSDPVQAAFVQAGVAHPREVKGIQTLGAIAYDPIWFFYRGQEVKQSDFEVVDGRSKFFAQKTISVGIEGSGTHAQAMRILNVAGLDRDLKFVYLPGEKAVKALQRGEIDGTFVVDSFEAPNVQTLLNDPSIHLVTFKRATAFAKLIPYMHILDVPEGSFSLQRNYPNSDTKMLATTTNLLIDDRMHPAVQFLFLEAAREINGKGSFFAKRGDFPSFKDALLPESPVAVHYEKNQYPMLATYLPFWLAELIDRLIFILLPFCAIAYPILQALPGYRTRRMQNKISRMYVSLKTIEQELLDNFNPEKRDEYLKRLDALEYQALKIKVSRNLSGDYYALRTSIDYVRNCLNRGVHPYQFDEGIDPDL